MKEGVREEEGVGDAGGEKEEEEEGHAGRRCSAGHDAAPATGPWHAAGRRLCGLVCEVVGGEGWDLRERHHTRSREVVWEVWTMSWFAFFIHTHSTALTQATNKDAPHSRHRHVNKQEHLSKQQRRNLQAFSFAQIPRSPELHPRVPECAPRLPPPRLPASP